jgi:hypothetical protein
LGKDRRGSGKLRASERETHLSVDDSDRISDSKGLTTGFIPGRPPDPSKMPNGEKYTRIPAASFAAGKSRLQVTRKT